MNKEKSTRQEKKNNVYIYMYVYKIRNSCLDQKPQWGLEFPRQADGERRGSRKR